MSKRRIGTVGRALTVTAVLLASAPMPALAQRGLSNAADDATVEPTDAPVAQHPRESMQGMQRMRGTQRGQAMQEGRGAQSTSERERLEKMREHMVSGMRRMAVRMAAIQDRLAALERGDGSAPPVASDGKGMGCAHGQKGQMTRDGMGGDQ